MAALVRAARAHLVAQRLPRRPQLLAQGPAALAVPLHSPADRLALVVGQIQMPQDAAAAPRAPASLGRGAHGHERPRGQHQGHPRRRQPAPSDSTVHGYLP